MVSRPPRSGKRPAAWLGVVLALAGGAPAQDGGVDPLDALDARAAEVLGGLERIRDRATHEREVPRLRRRLREAVGIDRLPEPRVRNLQAVGTLRFAGYRIEKLVYETLPGAEVPAHLYLPENAEGRRPAVLFVPGHWYADSKSKPDFQQMCAGLASLGMIVLAYDPIGQGERGISQRDHRRTELLAVGVSQQAIMVFESACALELLRARPDVDPDRIGITGASGGGFNSWMMAALDPRIACAVPVVGTSDFLEQLRAVRERDWYEAKEHCHFIPGLLRFANNHELLAMIAPRPLMVIAARDDHGFRIPGNRAVVEYGRALCGALGAPDRVGYFEDDTEGHGYGPRKRAAALEWLARWLLGREVGGAALAERPVPPWDAPELRCFPGNRPAGPALVALARSLAEKRDRPGLDVAGVLGLPLPPRLTSAPKLERDGDRLRWRMRDGTLLRGELRAPPGPWKGAILAAGDGDVAADGYAVVRIALRDAGRSPGWIYATSLLLGESFVGLQAMDLVGAWRSLRVLPELEGKPIAIAGSGLFASMAATFAARLEPRVDGLIVEGGLLTFESLLDRPASHPRSFALAKPGEERTIPLDREIPWALVVPGVLRRFDLPDLLGPKALVRGAVDGDFEPLEDARLRALAPRAAVGNDVAGFLDGLPAPAVPARTIGANPSRAVDRGPMPARVHVVEDYETEIERRWWLAGRVEAEEGGRVCRGTLANDFDEKMGDPARLYTAVIFNPVPGPPMGPRTRLAFRCRIEGGDRLRVQIYSLSKGFHRHLTLEGLPQGEWREYAVDLTAARRPDGSGGALEAGERIDDIQFYAPPSADLRIDDIALYDAGDGAEPFPSRPVFAAWFDTGRQGREWPGAFEIVPGGHGKAARGTGEIVVSLRGSRPLPATTRLCAWIRAEGPVRVALLDGSREEEVEWKDGASFTLRRADAVRFRAAGEILVDDLLLYGER